MQPDTRSEDHKNADHEKAAQEKKEQSLPCDKDALADMLYQDSNLRETVREALKLADGKIWREEQDKRYQREEVERITNIQGWLKECGHDNLTVGEPRGAIAKSQWTFGVYRDGNYLGNVESEPHSAITKKDVQLAVIAFKDKLIS